MNSPAGHRRATPQRPDTLLAHVGGGAAWGQVNVPVHRASTLLFPSVEAYEQAHARHLETPSYGRHGTPGTRALEGALAQIEGGHGAMVFPSGLAAICTALLAVLKAGDHLLVADSVYGPTRQFCLGTLARCGVVTTFFDPRAGDELEALFRPNTAALYLESPGSLSFELQDVPRLAQLARRRGCTVLMDNTWATPLYFRAFEHGVDLSIHAATKYLAGHSDLLLGAVIARDASIEARVRPVWAELGQTASADDCYLALRGLRTLSVRLARHQETGLRLAHWLAARPEVARVLHPGLPGSPDHALWRRDFLGASGLFGVELQPCSETALRSMVDGLRVFGIGASWGGYESLVLPVRPWAQRCAPGAARSKATALRIHAGLEDPRDLIEDLEVGLARLRA